MRIRVEWILPWALAASAAGAGVVRERWGPAGSRCTHPGTMQAIRKAKTPRLVFDLSAVATGARIVSASLHNRRVSQPREPIEVYEVERMGPAGAPVFRGKPIALRPPWHASFDVTEAVRRWVADPKSNLGLAFARGESFHLPGAYLEICYEGKPQRTPPQVAGLKAVHHDGQTFLTWQELPRFRPKPKQVLWVDRFEQKKATLADGPGKGFMDQPRLAAIYVKDLRELQMIDVIDPRAGTQDYPKLVRRKGWPEVRYRIYRSTGRITAANIAQAERVGEAGCLQAYDESMRIISSHGEYYDKREVGTSVIPTYCLADNRSVMPGEAFYVHTPQADGKHHYAVTAVRDGTENLAEISAANSLAAPVSEAKAPLKPVLQYIEEYSYRSRRYTAWKYYCWVAPPASNLPVQSPQRVSISIPKKYKEPGGLLIGGVGAIPGDDWVVLQFRSRHGYLGYNAGIGTFLSVRDSKVHYYGEHYALYMIRWALERFKIDRNRVMMTRATHFAYRHPELITFLRAGPVGAEFEIDFDQKFNPQSGSLHGRFGPADAARTVDGHKAWDIVNLAWYLKQNPAKDAPFHYAWHGGKESGHAVEYGWQDDPKGWAALRDARQPFVGGWGGGRPSRELYQLIFTWPWDKSVPAFSNGSLDGNPGNGDPCDGDPWGTINGHLLWEYQTIVDEPGRWEMTVYLAGSAGQPTCTVDITPRHRKAFHPKPGAAFAWTNTDLTTGKVVESGRVKADQWGLVTLKQVTVTKGKNRVRIQKP